MRWERGLNLQRTEGRYSARVPTYMRDCISCTADAAAFSHSYGLPLKTEAICGYSRINLTAGPRGGGGRKEALLLFLLGTDPKFWSIGSQW
jgi:hypothetical protein